MALPASRYLMEDPAEAMRLERKTSARFTRRLLRLTRLRKGETALDAGSGTGAVARVMAELVGPTGRIVAVDRSRQRIQHGKELASKTEGAPLRFLQGDLYRLPLEDASFDYAWCRFVFEYLEEPERALGELVRVVRPGGKVVIGDLDGNGIFHHPLPESLRAASERLVSGLRGRFDPYAGRKLYSLAYQAGLTDLRVLVFPYNLYAGAAPTEALANWKQKFDTVEPTAAKILGAETYRKLVNEFMDLLRRPDSLSYSLLFLVQGTKP
jgi:ubiquinone/menaquinone biosynthesis C-methylase UbiE